MHVTFLIYLNQKHSNCENLVGISYLIVFIIYHDFLIRYGFHWQVRGDIARAVMYMAVCYGFHLSDSPNKGRFRRFKKGRKKKVKK